MILGCFFTSFTYARFGYLDILIGTFLNFKFRTIFLLPTFLMIYISLYEYINLNQEMIIRMKNRKNVLFYEILMTLKVTIFFFIILLLIIMCFCNVIEKQDVVLTLGSAMQNAHPISVTILTLLRIFMMLLSFGLLTLVISSIFNNQKYIVIVGMAVSCILNLTTEILKPDVWYNLLNPGYHSFGLEVTNNLVIGYVSAIFYYLISIWLLITILRKNITKKNFAVYKK